MEISNKRNVASNLIWRFLERFGAQGVTLIVSIILARILDPVVYGTVALITVVTTILQVFVDSGLGTALVQKKEADSLDFSTVFYTNFVLCLALYVALFFAAPLIASFFNNHELTNLIRVLGILLIISGFKNVQNAYVARNLLFKKYFFATLGGTIAAAAVGIYMAYKGYGVWALIVQNIVNQAIDTIILWIIVKWKPTLEFSWKRLKDLFSYGWKLLVSVLLDTIWNEARQLIIGKKYSSDDLAFYNKGSEYPKHATTALNSSIDSVLLPVMSTVQDNPERVKYITKQAIKTGSFVLFPMMFGLAACSSSFISVVLTEKWMPAQPFLVIFCIVYAFYPIHTANLNAIKALGRSDLFLVLEIVKKFLNLTIILVSMWFGVFWLAIGVIVESLLSQIINSFPNRKMLNYSFFEQMKDIMPSFLLSLSMAVFVYAFGAICGNSLKTLLMQVFYGATFYLIGAKIFKIDSFDYAFSILKTMLRRKK